MPKQETHVPVVRSWCRSLGVLTAVSINRDDAAMRLAAFLPLLVDRFPDAAFTTASLQHVAARCVKGFPTYGELAAYLAEWWRANRPAPPALPPPPRIKPRDPPSPEQVAAVHELVQQTVAAMRADRPDYGAPDNDLGDVRRAPRAFHLSPAVLDQINPLPNGRRRAQ